MRTAPFLPVKTENYISKNNGKEYVLYKYPSGKRLFFVSTDKEGFLEYYTGANTREEAIHRLEAYLSGQPSGGDQTPEVRFIDENKVVDSANLAAVTGHIAGKMLDGEPAQDYTALALERLETGIHHLLEIPHYSLLADLMEASAVMEVRGVRKLAERDERHPIKTLERLISIMQTACREKNVVVFAQADVEFHFQLIKAYGNAMSIEIHQALHPLMIRYARQAAQDPQRQLSILVEHETVYTAILEGDAAKASQLMAIHVFQYLGDWEMAS